MAEKENKTTTERTEEELQQRKEQNQIRLQKMEELLRARRRERIRNAFLIASLVLIAGLMAVSVLFFRNPVKSLVVMEAGTAEFNIEDFLNEDADDAAFVTDLSGISADHVGTYEITLYANGRNRITTLEIEDTTAPAATTKNVTAVLNGELSPEDLIDTVTDATDVTCEFLEAPDLSSEGVLNPVVILTDEGGNTEEVTAYVTVVVDEEAPVIDGVAPINAFIGDPVAYKASVEVTDNCDEDADLEVDTSMVNPDEEGTYPVTYTATDAAGNTAFASTTITFTEKPDDYVDEETVLAEAQEILDEIITDDMTLKQKTQAIYNWVQENTYYVDSDYKDSWTNGAHIGFTTHAGDCFIYFSTAKALLTQAGIPNIDVQKREGTGTHHYWSLVNVGDGWYHLDTTPRESGATFFLLTDEEMLAYFEQYGTYEAFDTSLYPATPTEPSTIE